MLDPVVRNKISMTKSTDDLVVHVPKVSESAFSHPRSPKIQLLTVIRV